MTENDKFFEGLRHKMLNNPFETEELVDSFTERLNHWLKDRVHSEDGGWPHVSKEDYQLCWWFTALMFDLKFDLDCDRDQVISFHLADRSKGRLIATFQGHNATPAETLRTVRFLMGSANTLIDPLSYKLTQMEIENDDQIT